MIHSTANSTHNGNVLVPYIERYQSSAVGIATVTGWTVRWSNSVEVKFLSPSRLAVGQTQPFVQFI